MEHVIEAASSGRSKCRGCSKSIAKGDLRLGERLPNPFSDSTPMTLWFHLECAAYKRPDTFLEVVAATSEEVPDSDELVKIATFGSSHDRVPRITGVQRAPSGRAACRSCKETIGKGEWRIQLVYFEDGRFNPSGYAHPSCSPEYFGTNDILDRLQFFSPDLTADDVSEIQALLG